MKIKCITHTEYYEYLCRAEENSKWNKEAIRQRAMEKLIAQEPIKAKKPSLYSKFYFLIHKLLRNRFIVGKFYIDYNLYHSATRGPRRVFIYRLPILKSGRSSYPNPRSLVYAFEQPLKTYTVYPVNPK